MKDDFVREMTCSEPLTLEEEYATHREWLEDPNKLTFLIGVRDEVPTAKWNESTKESPSSDTGSSHTCDNGAASALDLVNVKDHSRTSALYEAWKDVEFKVMNVSCDAAEENAQ